MTNATIIPTTRKKLSDRAANNHPTKNHNQMTLLLSFGRALANDNKTASWFFYVLF